MFPTSHRLILEYVLCSYLPLLNGRVLILGAGNDPHGKKMTAATEIVRTDIDGTPPGIDVVADIHDLPFDVESFDSVVAIETLEHVADPKQAISEMHRVLRQGGSFLVAIPFMFHVHADPYDLTRLTGEGLQRLCSAFSGVDVRPYGGRLHVVSDIITTANKAAVAGRLLNHLLCAGPLKAVVSHDCPSGYVVTARK